NNKIKCANSCLVDNYTGREKGIFFTSCLSKTSYSPFIADQWSEFSHKPTGIIYS
ncbi:hypothetical protein ACJX0J_036583, partial [Zea mays]